MTPRVLEKNEAKTQRKHRSHAVAVQETQANAASPSRWAHVLFAAQADHRHRGAHRPEHRRVKGEEAEGVWRGEGWGGGGGGVQIRAIVVIWEQQ